MTRDKKKKLANENSNLFEHYNIDIDEDTATFGGEEVIVLKTYTRAKRRVALIRDQTGEEFEVYTDLLE